MTVLIGIPTHKRPDLLRKCLESIAAQQGVDKAIAVFVADNDPVGREGVQTVEQLAPTFRFPLTAEVVAEPGISAVRNAILGRTRRSGVEYLAMIDDDVRASTGWIGHLLEQQGATGADVVGGPVRFEFGEEVLISVRREFWTSAAPSGPVPMISGTGAILVNCSTLDRLGWPTFDPQLGLTGGEDKDWFLRLQRAGATFAWSAQAEALEWVPPERATRWWLLKRSFRVGTNDARNAHRYGSPHDRALLFSKAAIFLALAPAFALTLLSPRRRFNLPNRWSRSAGRLVGAAGIEFREYEARH